MTRITEKFSFDNGRGQKLAALIDRPEHDTPLFWGVFAPCFTCVKEAHGASKICRAMADMGAAMLRFDMTGLGQSEGDFATTNFTTRIADILAAVDACAAHFAPPKLVVGHSISGTALLSAAKKLPSSVTHIATIGSPMDAGSSIDKYFRQGLIDESPGDGRIIIDVLGRPTPFDAGFIPDMRAQSVESDTAAITQHLMVFHAPNDEIVDYTDAETINARAKGSHELVRLSDSATHLFEKGSDDAQFAARILMARVSGN